MQSIKRSTEHFARLDYDTLRDNQPWKRPRLDIRNPSALTPDELEDDAVLDADVIGARGQRVSRGAVSVDG